MLKLDLRSLVEDQLGYLQNRNRHRTLEQVQELLRNRKVQELEQVLHIRIRHRRGDPLEVHRRIRSRFRHHRGDPS